MTRAQAEAIQPQIQAGIASTLGVPSGAVRITGYSRRLRGRRLSEAVSVAFEVEPAPATLLVVGGFYNRFECLSRI